MAESDWNVIVVGGGHAGTEAAAAAARAGANTLLLTSNRGAIGEMSCNPAIGGLGKGHLVREIDALDGIMARAADYAGIQFRLLNRSKGPAVRGPRTQADRKLYREAIQRLLERQSKLSIEEAMVDDLLVEGGRCYGVRLVDGTMRRGRTVVLTTGTFLRGMIFRGEDRIPAGRIGEAPSVGLGATLERLGLPLGRLKTGTPPRLDGRTIDWSGVCLQAADNEPVPFSFLSEGPEQPQIACGITHTNPATHRIIEQNLAKSAAYGGDVSGLGPRYCPSIEDKIVRFGDRDSHQVFLEPEGLEDHTVYPNGLSTSLPTELQRKFLRTIRGLEAVDIIEGGYAIEYDFINPQSLRQTLELKALPGLFLAGQINGTTGYEEAAAQGLIAGLNAAASALKNEPRILGRSEAYIGVMIDDLVTRGVTEPYRMFTSRAEYRLSLRADNADLRLTPKGLDWHVVSADRESAFHVKQRTLLSLRQAMTATTLTPPEAKNLGIEVNADGRRRSLVELLGFPSVSTEQIGEICAPFADAPATLKAVVEADALYGGYLDRQEAEVAALRREEGLPLPTDFDYRQLTGLSAEVAQRLNDARPETLGQASRLEGVTPAALARVLVHIKGNTFSRAS